MYPCEAMYPCEEASGCTKEPGRKGTLHLQCCTGSLSLQGSALNLDRDPHKCDSRWCQCSVVLLLALRLPSLSTPLLSEPLQTPAIFKCASPGGVIALWCCFWRYIGHPSQHPHCLILYRLPSNLSLSFLVAGRCFIQLGCTCHSISGSA